MRVNIDSSGLAGLQRKKLAIALVRAPSDTPAPLAFMLPATSIISSTFTISVEPPARCFAAVGTFGSLQQVVPGLYSDPLDRSEIGETGTACVFASNAISAAPLSPPQAGTLLIENGGDGALNDLTMGLAETFSNTASNSSVEAPTLASVVESGFRWEITELPSLAYLFLISDNIAAGTIIPPSFYLPPPSTKASTTSRMVMTTRGLLVDLSDPTLTATYNSRTNSFVKS